jgi:glutathione S-transferase
MTSYPVMVKEISGSIASTFTVRMTFKRRLLSLGGFMASGMRLSAGIHVRGVGARPEQPMVLWERESSVQCAAVREAMSRLDLDAQVKPCPRSGTRFAGELGGGDVPRLEDPNAGATLRGARDILRHLYTRYGKGRPPLFINLPPVRAVTGGAMYLFNAGRGARARPSKAPASPLELWEFEPSPWCRFVRATLCELELPYVRHNVAKGSPRRAEFVQRSGRMQVPWLFDPNTGAQLFESAAIEQYLLTTYGA